MRPRMYLLERFTTAQTISGDAAGKSAKSRPIYSSDTAANGTATNVTSNDPHQRTMRSVLRRAHATRQIAEWRRAGLSGAAQETLVPAGTTPPVEQQEPPKEDQSPKGGVAKEPIAKWRSVEQVRRERFGQDMESGRGRSGEVPAEVLQSSRPPQSAFRVTGLAYHAWEQKLRERPLPAMAALDELRKRNAGNATMVNADVMSIVCDMETLCGAFLSMYCRHGSMEEGQRILQTNALPWIKVLSAKLRNGTFEFPTAAQLEPSAMNRPKHDPTLHPFPLWWNKTVPEAIRFVLEAVFEVAFLRSSHGFRPSKGCYTALREVKYGFAGVDYLMVGDLSQCMEAFSKPVLVSAIRNRISDVDFLKLVDECLKQEYVDLSAVCFKSIGLPQTTLLSPILCNIYLHAMDRWFEDLMRCLTVGGRVPEKDGNVHGMLGNRSKYGAQRIGDIKAWKSPTLKAVRYVRYGTNFLMGVNGLETDMEQLELDLVRFVKSKAQLDYKEFHYNRVVASSPDKAYVVFLGAEIYVAPQISSPGTNPSGNEASRLPNRPRLCVPARLLIRKLQESGFVDPDRKRPRYCHRLVMWECHEIVKYYDIVVKLFCMYYTFADNYHCLLLLYDVLKQSCSLTLARKLGLKRMWHVHKRLEKDLIVRDMEGTPLASFERPCLQRPVDPFVGRDINPFIRIERPSRPKFPPVKLGEAFFEPRFPLSKMELSLRSRIPPQHGQR